MTAEIRYCTTEDGVRIAYSVEGSGYPLLWCPVFVESFSLTHLVPVFAKFTEVLARRWQLIRFDMRGSGLSDRGVTNFSSSSVVEDVRAVARAVGAERIAIWGNTMSGPRAIAFAAVNPDLVTHLILHDTFARPVDAFAESAVQALAQLARSNWRMAAQMLGDMGSLLDTTDARTQQLRANLIVDIGSLYEQSADGNMAA